MTAKNDKERLQLSEAEKKRHFQAANRWHGRKKGARSRADRLRCHALAMEHTFIALGKPQAGKLL